MPVADRAGAGMRASLRWLLAYPSGCGGELMADGTLYRLEVLDFHQGLLGGSIFPIRAMPPNVLIIKVPSEWSEESMRSLREMVLKLLGLVAVIVSEEVEFCWLRKVEEMDMRMDGEGRLSAAGQSIRLVGD